MPKPSRNFTDLSEREDNLVDVSYRSLELRSSTIDIETRSIEADIASENYVLMPDFGRMEMVPEVLLMDGIEMPKSRQIPLLDSHNRGRVADQLGSARELAVKDGKLTSRLHFSEASQNEFTKVREGHVTDVSVGYLPKKKVYVPKGETKSFSGRSFTGPVNVVTKWKPREASMTPIGADELAKTRGLDPSQCRFLSPTKKDFEMNEELRKLLIEKGMDSKLTDEEAQRWMVDSKDTLWPKMEKLPPVEGQRAESVIDMAAIGRAIVEETRKFHEAERVRVDAFRKEVDANCDLAGLPDAKSHCRSLGTLEEVRTYLIAEQQKQVPAIPYGVSIRQTGSGFDELTKDMGTALTMRALQGASSGDEKSQKAIDKVFPVESRAKGATNFRNASLFDMATEYVRGLGVDTRDLSRNQIAICAMFGPQTANIRSGGPGYHTTGSFTNLTLDATNKAMMLGYTECPTTWRGPMRQATSVPDFKNINRIRMGAISNLPIWNDNLNPENASFADAKEVYAVESRSLNISFSYRLLVNDDMDSLSRVPAMMGAAAARTVNAVAWAQITSNPTMSDAVALFSTATGARKRANLTTGSATPTVLTIQTMANQMRQMRGENTPEGNESADILNLQPVYIVGPGALDTTIKQLVRSIADPAASQAGVYNTASYLQPVIEPLLDVASTTAWYLFASTSQIDTVEVSFLQGQETPETRSFMDERTLAQNFTILQTFAAKAMNHRGVIKHAGA